ncbi:MAG: hypothetical protein HGA77_04895 [Chlorobiaceae bacterium]|nr:hypothetical protein [Chlorobiaceae bacterium]
MKARISVEHIDEIRAKFQSMADSLGPTLFKAYLKGAVKVQNEARKSIQQGGRSGRIYRKNRGKYHQAAGPGEPPKTDTGIMVSSIAIEPEENWVLVGSGLKYAKVQEFGTSNMPAHPWLVPALEKNRREIEEDIQKATIRAIK